MYLRAAPASKSLSTDNNTGRSMAKGTKPEGHHGAPRAAGKGGGGDVPAAAGEEVVMRAPVHCDGCARKLRRSLQRLLDGEGEVIVDRATNTVVVKGQKAAGNAAEAVRIVEKRTGRKAVLLSPAPEKLPPPTAKGEGTKKKDGGKNKDVTDDLPEINMKMVVVLRMNLHCDACCEEIKRRILRIKGVEDAVPHLKSSQMMVKGVVEPATLVGFIHNCTGRKAAIFRAEPLDHPPQAPPSSSPPLPPPESEAKKPENTGGKKDGQDNNGNKEEEDNKAGGGEDDSNKQPKTEKKPDGGGDGDAGEEEKEEPHGDGDEDAKDDGGGGGDGVVVESNKKGDHLFAAVPVSPGVVTVAPPPPPPERMAVNGAATYYYSYPPSCYYHYAHPSSYQYQCPPPMYYPPYPYACGGADMYGYPSYPTTEAFSEENPNTCAIV